MVQEHSEHHPIRSSRRTIPANPRAGSNRAPGQRAGSVNSGLILQMQQTCGNQVTGYLLRHAQHVVQRDTAKAQQSQAGALLKGVGAWASEKKDRTKVVDTGAVVGLDPGQSTSISSALTKLDASIPLVQGAANEFNQPLSQLQQALTSAKDAASQRGGDEADRLMAKHNMDKSRTALAGARAQLSKMSSDVDVSKLVSRIKKIEEIDDATDAIKYVNETVATVRSLQKDQLARVESLRRITFLLRGFLAINVAGFAGAPSLDEIKKLKSQLAGGMVDDFNAVFGEAAAFELFENFSDRLARQLDVREHMAEAGVPGTSPVPPKANVESYFRSLRGSSSDKVFSAYTEYASAYFYHLGVSNVADLTASLADLYARPMSITGVKPLVCAGYATIGAEAVSWAGGTKGSFIVAIRATDEALRSDQNFDDAHALAKVTLNGKSGYISNSQVVNSEKEGIGPDAVAWANKDAPIFVGRGATLAVAVQDVVDKLAKAKNKLKPQK